VERIYRKYSGSGFTAKEALEKAAKYLGVTVDTAMKYYSLVALPEDIKEMVDKASIPETIAVEIVRNTYDASRFEQSQEAMRERTSWVLSFGRDQRDHTIEALAQLGSKASIADLNNYVEERMEESKLTVQYTIPVELHSVLLKWGKERGLKDESTIVSFMITEVLNKGAR